MLPAHSPAMADLVSWIATAATVMAACMTASNLGARLTGYGFGVFTIGSVCWFATGFLTGQPALVWTNAVLTILNVFGVWRWLGRQVQVEEGARTAAQASEETPGEALFPVSMLGRAPVRCGSTEIGSCVDAMAGCRSGRLAYLVVTQGGVAGVGETLRRLSWRNAYVAEEAVVAEFDVEQFSALPEMSKDEWPAR
jgi:hypothetical protein